ncbi:MAG: rRNA maturation RNase YbeY [Acidobacteria bacterium]|nr:rRNA maturation RNase YbeY [Acidobacteriota bacterium]
MSIDDPDSEPDPARSPRRRRLRVVVTDGRGRVRRADRLRRWLTDVAPDSAGGGEVVVALVCDRKMRDLNRDYRGIDRATDVLSFPATDEVAPDVGIEPVAVPPDAVCDSGAYAAADPDGPRSWISTAPGASGGARHLGDIVIATGVARRQARAAGHRFGAELRCLALHGLLHLLGYDHERDTGQMERLERRLRRAGGLA